MANKNPSHYVKKSRVQHWRQIRESRFNRIHHTHLRNGHIYGFTAVNADKDRHYYLSFSL